MRKIYEGLKSQMSPYLRFLIGILSILSVLVVLGLVYVIAIQQYRIRHCVTTEAKILSSEVVKSRKIPVKISTYTWRYTPHVEYSYVVAGHQYISSNITMISPYDTTRKWAEEIVAKYRPDAVVIAYYNPRNPKESFLLYEIAFWPYPNALFWFALLCVCATIYFMIGKIYNKPSVPSQISGNCYALNPNDAKKTFKKAIAVCLVYYFVGVVIGILWFSITDKPYESFPQTVYAIYFILGIIPICYFGYYAWRFRNLQSPEVCIDRPHLRAGEKVKIKVAQKFKKAVELINTEMALICTTYYESKDKRGKDCIRSQDDVISKTILCKERPLSAGDLLEFEEDILIPPGVHKSGFSEGKDEFPFYRWYFRITNTQTNGFAYTTKYFVNCE